MHVDVNNIRNGNSAGLPAVFDLEARGDHLEVVHGPSAALSSGTQNEDALVLEGGYNPDDITTLLKQGLNGLYKAADLVSDGLQDYLNGEALGREDLTQLFEDLRHVLKDAQHYNVSTLEVLFDLDVLDELANEDGLSALLKSALDENDPLSALLNDSSLDEDSGPLGTLFPHQIKALQAFSDSMAELKRLTELAENRRKADSIPEPDPKRALLINLNAGPKPSAPGMAA